MNREAQACKRLVSDETYAAAISEVMGKAASRVLTARTPEDREQKWQEYDAFRRVDVYLRTKANEADMETTNE